MKAQSPSSQSASAFKKIPERLQGVLVYEDLETGTRAKDVCDHLLYQIDVDTEMDLALWRFDMLQDPAVNKHAADHAATADIVVLSAHHGGSLSPEVRLWLRRWLDSKHGDGHSALVVSLDQDAHERSDEARLLASLRTMVESAGVDLIPHYGELRNPLALSAERMRERVEATNALFPETNLPRPTTYENWGINE
jgi:hypothetical protein